MTTEVQPHIAFVIEFGKISGRKSLREAVKAKQPGIRDHLQDVPRSANMLVYDTISTEQLLLLRAETPKFGGSLRELSKVTL